MDTGRVTRSKSRSNDLNINVKLQQDFNDLTNSKDLKKVAKRKNEKVQDGMKGKKIKKEIPLKTGENVRPRPRNYRNTGENSPISVKDPVIKGEVSVKILKKVKTKKENIADKNKVSEIKTENPTKKPDVLTKTLTYKGVVPVDDYCIECKDSFHVFVSGGNVFNAMLNQTNIGQNNNKYYLLQILQSNSGSEFCVWFRWGRVGKVAGTNLQRLGHEKAVEIFEKKFKDKTANFWECRTEFEKIPGKYDYLEMDYGEEKQENEQKKQNHNKIESKLDKRVKAVMELIFDLKEFENSVKEMKYDVKKAPLGKLTEKQIKSGYEALKLIEDCIKRNNFGRALVEACSQFYTKIPHDFGMRCPPVVRSPAELQEKLELLTALADIQIAIKIMDDSSSSASKENPLDLHYKSLQCELVPLPKSSNYFKVVQEYISNTHAATHMNYKLSIDQLFSVSKDSDSEFQRDIGNRVLLWHGSRLSNWCGILREGLRIAPPEAPSTGYMFGKGIYFADMVSKSANYCFATQRQTNGFLLLCEVSLGNTNELLQADYNGDRLPVGKHSVKGVGKTQPNPSENKTIDNDVTVPCGLPVLTESAKDSALLYNEYVVYSAHQVKPRFLVKVNFHFTQNW